jgi:hypothetical protein
MEKGAEMVRVRTQFSAQDLTEVLETVLPTGDRMSSVDKDFWLDMSRRLTSEQLGQLAKVVAFMRTVEGF